MQTAQRVRHLILERNRHSIREAATKTGVPKSTLQRIMDGSIANLEKWLPLIAEAYGVQASSLMSGNNPKDDFEWSIRRASARERFDMLFMTIQDRLRDTIHFLVKRFHKQCSYLQIAAASGLQLEDLHDLMARWDRLPPDMAKSRAIARGINLITGIAVSWFERGLLEDDPPLLKPKAAIPRAGRPARTRCRAALIKEAIDVAARRLQLGL